MDVLWEEVGDVRVITAVIHEDHLVQDLRRCPIQDAPNGSEQSGEGLVVEDDDHAG